VPVVDRLGQRHEQAGGLARVVAVDEHRALLERRAVPFDRQIDDRVEQRMAGSE